MTDLITIAGLIFIIAGLAYSIYVGGLRRCSDYHLMPDHSSSEHSLHSAPSISEVQDLEAL